MTTITFTADTGHGKLESDSIVVELGTGKLWAKTAGLRRSVALVPLDATQQSAATSQVTGLADIITAAQAIS